MKWEYELMQLNKSINEIERQFKDKGKEGWELVAIIQSPELKLADAQKSSVLAFFKRPSKT